MILRNKLKPEKKALNKLIYMQKTYLEWQTNTASN